MGHLPRFGRKKKIELVDWSTISSRNMPIEGKGKIIKEIRSEIRKSDFVYLATDPGPRGGEAISWHIKELSKPEKDSKRVTQ